MKKYTLGLLFTLVTIVSYGQVIEKETTYVLKMSEKEYQEYVNSKKETTSYRPRYIRRNVKDEKSFGVVGGYSTFLGKTSIMNFSWGSWIDLGVVGVEYNTSVGVNLEDPEMVAEKLLSRQIGEWYSGGTSRNIGIFTKTRNHMYYGIGAQVYELYGLKISDKGTTYNGKYYPMIVPETIQEKKVIPYVTIGYIQKLNDIFTFKGGVVLSKFSMVNVGVGYSF